MEQFWFVLAALIGAPMGGLWFGRRAYKGELPRWLVAIFCGMAVFGGIIDVAQDFEEWMGWRVAGHLVVTR